MGDNGAKESRPLVTETDDDAVQRLAETTDLSPNQARELVRRYGSDRRKLEEAARTFKAEG
jgi:sRNA-binding protein